MRLLSLLALPILTLTPAAFAQDSDNDGVPDTSDALPCDGAASGEIFAPASGQFGLLLFEDEWPTLSDLDFNDVAVAYNYAVRVDGSNRAVSVQATLHPLALGGAFTHGLALHLPIPASAVADVTLTIEGQAAQTITPRGDAELTVDVAPDLRALFGGQPDPINSVNAWPVANAPAIQIDVTLSTPTTLSMAQAPFDVFIYRTAEPGHEIHRTGYAGSNAMDTTLFGMGNDASTPGRWFVDGSGLPYALHLPQIARYPQEAVPVSALYPDILTFASSGGATNGDFYATNVQSAYGYTNTPAPNRATSAAPVDTTCLPAGAPCAALLQQGNTTSGVYMVDPDGAGGMTPFEVYCDMQTADGGWTLISNRRANTTNTEACGGTIRGFFTNGCGSAQNVSASDSYALDATRRAAVIADASEVMLVQYLDGVEDTDDAYILELPSPGIDLFPNQSNVRDFPIARVCTLDGVRCDASAVWFKYSGDSWYHSSVCSPSNWANSYAYRGNYGLCHDGWTGASSSYFTGNRVGYEETKLWAHPNGGAAYQERIFYR